MRVLSRSTRDPAHANHGPRGAGTRWLRRRVGPSVLRNGAHRRSPSWEQCDSQRSVRNAPRSPRSRTVERSEVAGNRPNRGFHRYRRGTNLGTCDLGLTRRAASSTSRGRLRPGPNPRADRGPPSPARVPHPTRGRADARVLARRPPPGPPVGSRTARAEVRVVSRGAAGFARPEWGTLPASWPPIQR